MRILSIETSCDETAISIVETTGDFPEATYEVKGNALASQIEVHRAYGGVFPQLGKREHIKAIVPLFAEALREAELLEASSSPLTSAIKETVASILVREETLAETLLTFFDEHDIPEIHLIAVTTGPGLEPALWVGVNFAKALAAITGAPVVPVNHMEGHILASIFDAERDNQLSVIPFPTLAVLLSGGHTELLLMKEWGEYEKVGQTLDDALGEAFDKVARLLGLPYPGGPEISKLAAAARKAALPPYVPLPKPMLHSGDLNFSFSGLKTAVRYALADKILNPDEISSVARDFEDVVVEVVIKKILTAVEQFSIKTIVVGGGVSANKYLKFELEKALLNKAPHVTCYFPRPGLSTDNSIMIALAGHKHAGGALSPAGARNLAAEGNKEHRKIPLHTPLFE